MSAGVKVPVKLLGVGKQSYSSRTKKTDPAGPVHKKTSMFENILHSSVRVARRERKKGIKANQRTKVETEKKSHFKVGKKSANR